MTEGAAPLVLLHGFAQLPASWREVRELLPTGRIVLAPELPGHGNTALSLGEPTPELARETVAAAIRAAGGSAVVWGYSQGARVALDLVLNEPELVSALILESGTAGIEDPAARAERSKRDDQLSERIESRPIKDFVDDWERVPALGEQSIDVIEKQRPIRLSHDPVALAAALRGMGQAAYEPMWDSVAEIAVPVLLLTGAQDPAYEDHAERLADLIPNARRSSIAGAGHAAHISDPAAATKAVVEFLEGL
ncbi:MAG: alpha/beta fold hydrolase [Solirubrobacterales bacterium]